MDGVRVLWHHKRIMLDVARFSAATEKWDAAPPMLRTLALMGSASTIGCEWCLDLGYYMGSQDGLDEEVLREVPRWKESEAFSPVERSVLAYAEAMSTTPVTVTDEMVAELLAVLGPKAVVEITELIAFENMNARFNLAAGLTPQGFSQACELPLARAGS